MVEPMLIDLKALLVEREDCDAGTVQQLRNALAQGGTQYRTLRDVTETLKKKLEAATGAAAKRWHLKLGIALFFLGYTRRGRRAPQAGRRRAGQLLPGPRPGRRAGVRRGPQGLREGREGRLHRQPGAAAAGRHLPPQGRPGPGPPSSPSSKSRPATTPSTTSSSPAASWPRASGRRPSSTWNGPSSWTPATPAPCSSSATPTTWPATTTRPSPTTSAA